MEKLIDGKVPNRTKSRGEEGKWKNKRKSKGEEEGNPTNLLLFFPVPVFCHMSFGSQFILIKQFNCNDGTSSTFIH